MNERAIRPWGLSRASDFAEAAPLAYTIIDVDPVTQLGRFRDSNGVVVDPVMASPKHGSGTTTNPRTATGQDGGGGPAPDSDSGFDSDRD
ncbi:putative ATP-grasp target RiPP [Kribbella sp. VKM Ac-2571]|nr:putative ATP-grasp-modified RiPP [Kribbella sp. VKM Ac-2571]TDO67222.1 putative ATP-grasp target RiPP [Kribbella sp. VKM Ac-2571]